MKKFLKRAASALLAAACAVQVLAVGALADSGFNTNLENLRALGGTMNTTTDGVTLSGSGDCFAISDSTADSFVYSADVKFNENRGAASLIFCSADSPSQASYCANIDKNNRNARIFAFQNAGGSTKGEYALTAAQQQKNEFNIKVQFVDDTFTMFIDSVPVISFMDKKAAQSGNKKFGILTYNTSVTYQNVLFESVQSKLSGFSMENAELSPAFSSDVHYYTATNSFDNDTVSFAASDAIKQVFLLKEGSSEAESVTASNGKYTVKLASGQNKILAVCDNATYIFNVKLAIDPDSLYTEENRSQLHFSPIKNWMNDPNGLVYDPSNGTYHLFYQYNPYGLNIANQVWAHAESTDLMNWTQIDEIAIDQDDELGAIFSGCCVVDDENTSGFFTDNKPGESKLVALYTSDAGDQTYGLEKQSIAYSKDHGHTWTKPSIANEGFKNPVIKNENNKYGRDFRDPKVFKYDGKWMMVIAGGRARLFTSDDLIHWNEAGDLGFDSECPDLYPLAVDGNQDNMKWVYTASGRWYTIGDLTENGEINGVKQYKYTSLTGRLQYNGAPEVYATQSYYNDGSGQNRKISISWLQDYSASQISGKNWNGYDTLPHEMGIVTVNGEMRLTSYPVEELNNYRTDTLYTAKAKTVNKGDANILANVAGDKYDIEAEFTIGTATEFGFRLRCGKGQYTEVKYKNNQLIMDRSSSGKVMGGVLTSALIPQNGKVKMRIVVDKATIEAFGNDGEAAISAIVFPDANSLGMEFFTDGSVTVDSMNVYYLKSALRKTDISPAKGLYLASSNSKIAVGETMSVSACNFTGLNDDIKWTVSDDSVVSIVKNADGTVGLTGVKNGTAEVTATVGDYSDTLTVSVVTKEFITNMTGWTPQSGKWDITDEGYFTYGVSGTDAFAFSDVTRESFVYEADIAARSDLFCAGLVFGKSGNTWYGANITISGSSVATKLFKNTGNEEWNVKGTVAKANNYHLKIVAENNRIKYYVNDKLVASKATTDNLSGLLGLVSYNGPAAFNNVNSFDSNDPMFSETGVASVTVDGVTATRSGDAFSVTVDSADSHTVVVKTVDEKATVKVAADQKAFTVTAQNGTQKIYTLTITEKSEPTPPNPTPTPTPSVPKNGTKVVNGKTVLYQNSKAVTGTKVVTVGGKTYAVVKGYVKTGTKTQLVKIGKKTYVVDKNGVVVKAKANKLIKIGAKSYVLSKNGTIVKAAKNKLVKVGKKSYIVNKQGVVQKNKKSVKVGKKVYKVSKKGVATIVKGK